MFVCFPDSATLGNFIISFLSLFSLFSPCETLIRRLLELLYLFSKSHNSSLIYFLFALLHYVLGQFFRSILKLTNMLFICVAYALHQSNIFNNKANVKKL